MAESEIPAGWPRPTALEPAHKPRPHKTYYAEPNLDLTDEEYWAAEDKARKEYEQAYAAEPLRKLPVPWILCYKPDSQEVDWLAVRPDSSMAHHQRLCQVCAEPLGPVIVLGEGMFGMANGSGCHPRCMALAIKFCPHFSFEEYRRPCFLYVGDGHGYSYQPQLELDDPFANVYSQSNELDPSCIEIGAEEVVALAKHDPMGVKADDAVEVALAHQVPIPEWFY